jgi:hypothetical protein
MGRRLVAVMFAASFLLGAGASFAQNRGGAAPAPDVKYKQKTVYDFEDDIVEGALVRPDGTYVDTRRKTKVSSLIKIRENFIPEMVKSVEDL